VGKIEPWSHVSLGNKKGMFGEPPPAASLRLLLGGTMRPILSINRLKMRPALSYTYVIIYVLPHFVWVLEIL
jgi:hypothetical protein